MQQIDQCRHELETVADLLASQIRTPLQTAAGLSPSQAEQYDHCIGLRTATLVDDALKGVAQVEQLLNDLLKWSHSELDACSANPSTSNQDKGGSLGETPADEHVCGTTVDGVSPTLEVIRTALAFPGRNCQTNDEHSM